MDMPAPMMIDWITNDGLASSRQEVFVPSLGTTVGLWCVVENGKAMDSGPMSSKQHEALHRFIRLDKNALNMVIRQGLEELADRAEHASEAWGSMLEGQEEFHLCAQWLSRSAVDGTFSCEQLVVPSQNLAPCRFVIVCLEIPTPTRDFPYEVEAVFADERLVLAGENSGLWARLEWDTWFNTSAFDAGACRHPYF